MSPSTGMTRGTSRDRYSREPSSSALTPGMRLWLSRNVEHQHDIIREGVEVVKQSDKARLVRRLGRLKERERTCTSPLRRRLQRGDKVRPEQEPVFTCRQEKNPWPATQRLLTHRAGRSPDTSGHVVPPYAEFWFGGLVVDSGRALGDPAGPIGVDSRLLADPADPGRGSHAGARISRPAGIVSEVCRHLPAVGRPTAGLLGGA